MSNDLVDLRGAPRLVPAWELVDEFLDVIADALGVHGDTAEIRNGLVALRERGTGAQRQRAAAAGSSIDQVVDALTLRT
jgi:carboxylate-amine ligase